MRKFLFAGLLGLLALVFAACGASATPVPQATPTTAPQAQAEPQVKAPGGETELVTSGESFKFQLVSPNRTLNTFPMLEEYARKVAERTNGQVQIELTSYPELGITGFDLLRTVKDGTIPFAEVYSGFVGGDFPLIEMGELLGLFPDSQTQERVLEAIREDEIRVVKERFDGEVLFYNFYPDQFFFSKKPLNSLEDFKGLRTRSHSVPLGDLINGLGGEPQTITFAEVYTALERGILEAGVTGSTPGYGQKWYEVTKYLVGPLKAHPHTMIMMNKNEWAKLPPDIQQIMREEGAEHMEENLRLVTQWDQEGVDQNVAQGMIYSDFTPEMREAMQKAVVITILPNWVKRVGGPDSEAVRIFNDKVAPIVGMRIAADGSVEGTVAMTVAPGQETRLVTRGQKYEFQYVNVTRTVQTFPLLEDFAKRVYDRTDGQVQITLTSYPELGISGFDALRLIKDGSLEFSEIYSGFVGGDFPLIEMGELLGLFPDAATQRKVLEDIREDEIRLVRERFNGEVLFYSFYPDQYFFSKRPLNTLEDFKGLKVRSHSVPLGDLISSLGGAPTTMAFAEVYTAMERGILEGGVTVASAGHGQKWYEVTKYLVGPLHATAHTMITMNGDSWKRLPPDIQAIIREEGAKNMERNLRELEQWNQDGVAQNVAEGMVYSDFTPEMRQAMRDAVTTTILPNWVGRVGGPDSEAVKIFNDKVAPIVGMRVNADSTISSIPITR